MEKKVQRKEVNINIKNTASAQGAGGNSSTTTTNYQVPSADDLERKYKLTNNSDEKALQEKQQQIEEYQLKENILIADNHKLETTVNTLKGKLDEKNRKLEQLCVMLEALGPVPGVNPAKIQEVILDPNNDMIDMRDAKIVSLARKSHNLNMQVNKERATNDRLTQQVEEMQKRVSMLTMEIDVLNNEKNTLINNSNSTKSYNRHTTAAQDKKVEDDNQLQQLQRSLREMTKNHDELKKRVKELTDENKQLQKTLVKEIGDNISLEQAVDDGWRGRAQQIVMLKSKVKQLENQLQNGNHTNSVHSNQNNSRCDVDSKAEDSIIEMSRERRAIVEQLTEERIKLMEINQALEKKSSGYKARIQTLENEVRKMKENIQVVFDKSNTDDELLDALRSENQRLLQQNQQLMRKRGNEDNNNNNNNSRMNSGNNNHGNNNNSNNNHNYEQMQAEIHRLQRQVRAQTEQLDTQDSMIRELRKRQTMNT